MREATMANTRSRSRQGLEPISEAKPRRCMDSATAWTWPWARDAVISKHCATGSSSWPSSTERIASTCAIDKLERFARVRLCTFVPSR